MLGIKAMPGSAMDSRVFPDTRLRTATLIHTLLVLIHTQAVVLGIKAMAGSAMDPRVFGFIDPPPPDRLEAAMTNLKQVRPLKVGS